VVQAINDHDCLERIADRFFDVANRDELLTTLRGDWFSALRHFPAGRKPANR
jgi:hypothetical protein